MTWPVIGALCLATVVLKAAGAVALLLRLPTLAVVVVAAAATALLRLV